MWMRKLIWSAPLWLAVGAAVSPGALLARDNILERMMAGGPILEGKELRAALAEAEHHPLGSLQNPVRAAMPQGQQAYLRRLRCADGEPPRFQRAGNLGQGVFSSIVDDYVVDCGPAAPGKVHIIMDMYFPDYVEERPVAGFTIAPGNPDLPPSGGAPV
jgi:hypothetical protein